MSTQPLPRSLPRIVVAHRRPDDVRSVIEGRFPDAPVRYVSEPGEIDRVLREHDPEVAFTIKDEGFTGTLHSRVVMHKGLKWFHVGGSGYEHIQPWNSERVVVTNSAGVLAPYLAETVIGAILALNGHFLAYLHRQGRCEWKRTPFRPLRDQTLLVVGLGHIGAIVAEHASHLGMRVIAIRRSAERHPSVDELHTPEALSRLLPRADFVSLHVRLNEETHHLIDADALALMRRGSFLVNTSRGAVVDEAALADALHKGHLAGAYLDVFEAEPLPSASELWSIPNLLITPHTADNIAGWPAKFAELFVENLALWLDGKPLRNVVVP